MRYYIHKKEVMEPINTNILPSHDVLHQLALMRQFQEDQGDMPELFIFDKSVEVKVKEHAKSLFDSWTSRQEWKNWLTWQQPGLKNLPYLLKRTINELKLEFTDAHAGEYKLKETIKELEMAVNGLDKVRSFKSLDSASLTIINQAMIDILKFQMKLTDKYQGKEDVESKDLGVAYYIPKIILAKMGKIEEKNLKEAEEINGNLGLLLKSEVSVKTLMRLQTILEKDRDPNLKNTIKLCLKGDMTAFDVYHEIKPEAWEVSGDDALKIKDLLNKVLFKSFIETSDTGRKLKDLVDPDFQFSVGIIKQTALNLRDESGHESLKEFLDKFQLEGISNFLQALPQDGKDFLIDINDAIKEFNQIGENVDLKVVSQFKKDYLRKMEFEREDAYHNIKDELTVPNNFQNLDERLKFAANAVEELCLPRNAHNQKFIPVIQMALTQMSLSALGAAEGSFYESVSYPWIDGTDQFRWKTAGNQKIKIEVIHDSLGNIEKVNAKIKCFVQIVEKNDIEELNIGENKIVIKDAITVNLSYSLKFDNDGALQIEDYDCKFNISLK